MNWRLVLFIVFAATTIDHCSAAAQDATGAASPAGTNDLIRQRCVVCHNTAKPLGGLNLQLFDAAKPDPAVALMMSIKVSKDGAMFAAGDPAPSTATIEEFLRLTRASAVQSESVSGPWTIDLQTDPRAPDRGHAVVVAYRRSASGEVRLTCNATKRLFEVTPSQPRPDFQGLSPIMRAVFTWCLDGLADSEVKK